MERLSSGNERLDEILSGGLPRHSINLFIGVPGSGKTILSQQFVFHNATQQQPALYLSTLSEPLDKILRYGESLTFFDQAAIQDGRIRYEDIGSALRQRGLDEVLHIIDARLKEFRPGIVVIDSVASFRASAHSETEFANFLFELTRRLTADATTSIWNASYSRDHVASAPEFAVADAIVALDIKRVAERELRVLQILKLRGSGFRSGEHGYRITESGLNVFPRLADIRDPGRYDLGESHSATGIQALDELLGEGGYWAGTTTAVVGPSGIGKTLMGLHFLYRGAEVGEVGVLATFQENASQLERIVKGFGWSIDNPGVNVISRSVVDLNIDEWVYELLDVVEKSGGRRVVIDSLADLELAAADRTRFREWMYSLIQRFSRSRISLMVTIETPNLFSIDRISEVAISHLADNVVVLQYVRHGPELWRTLTVVKTRAQRHRPVVHRYEITSRGFELGEVLSAAT